MEFTFGDYIISNDKSRLNLNTICDFLSRSYWANKRSMERIKKSITTSICFGVYHKDKQIGFARVVTDEATMYWLCDVFIDEDYTGQGIGKKMVEVITTMEDLRNLTGFLGTLDAHDLYEQYGFERDPDRFMKRIPDFLRVRQ
jgi:GNAT superfamily N-acetyltransferase